MKRILVVLSLVCFSTLNGQSLNEAEKLFNVFEYQRAYAIYHQLKADKTFSSEDIKRYAYSSYTIGEFETCYSLFPELTAIKDIEPFFTYMKGEVCLNLKKYDEAKQAYSAYQAMDDEYNVTYKIESCDLISTWENQETLELINSTGNNSKADFCGVKTPFGQIEYHEEGVDSSGIEMTTDLVDYSELLLLRPFLKDREGNLHRIVLEEAFKYASVNSMAIHPSTGNVFLSLSEPVSNVLEKTSPHIYKGTWNATEFSISAISPWEFGGFNDTSSCAHVTLSENGELLAFSKMTDEQSDIYLSKFSNNIWNNPTSLEQVNTNLNEMYPLFQGDSVLSFATDGRPGYGNLDIHTYNLSNHNITHLKAPVNSSKDDFNFVYESADSALFVSNRFGGKGDDDIYYFESTGSEDRWWSNEITITESNEPAKVALYHLRTQIVNARNKPIAKAKVGIKRNGEIQPVMFSNAEGYLDIIDLNPADQISFNASKEKYLTKRSEFLMDGREIPKQLLKKELTDTTFDHKITLGLAEVGEELGALFDLNPIYYDLDKSNIRPDAAAELDKIVQVLKDNPGVSIELGSHTDARASASYNLKLSQRRAESAVKYIIEHGIEASRIKAKGYGETQLINGCSDGVDCSEEAHQENRRTEFKITDLND